MPENAIIAEIHRHREAVSRECVYDAAALIAYYSRREAERGDDGHPLVSLIEKKADSCIVREEPPPSRRK